MNLTPEEVKAAQVVRLLKLGFHKKANKMTEKEFTDLTPMPEDRPGAIVVVKAEVVSISEQMELIGGKCNLNIEKLIDVVKIPNAPIYWRYDMEDGREMLNIPPDFCMEILFKEQNRIGAVVVEGIAIVAQDPDVLKYHSMDLPGSRFDAKFVPYLGLFNGRPRLDYYYCPGKPYPNYGSASFVRVRI